MQQRARADAALEVSRHGALSGARKIAAHDESMLVKLATLHREIADGQVTASFAVSNEDALGYNEHGLPT